jgi:hypothetical protein
MRANRFCFVTPGFDNDWLNNCPPPVTQEPQKRRVGSLRAHSPFAHLIILALLRGPSRAGEGRDCRACGLHNSLRD